MNTDSAFYIGKTHDICEDYALSNENSIVLSDGCSGSLHTDIGSRLLCFNSLRLLSTLEQGDISYFQETECLLEARPSTLLLNLPTECLDATLLLANSNKYCTGACVYGDGYIIVELKDRNKYIINNEYVDNYPYYINYLYDHNRRLENWTEDHDKKKVSLSLLTTEGHYEIINDNCDFTEHIKEIEDPIFVVRSQLDRTIVEILDVEQVKYIAISSDGLGSFYESVTKDTSKINQPVSDTKVIEMLLSFKNFNGKFVQRRMNKFRKMCKQQNWHHADDISLGVIYLGE